MTSTLGSASSKSSTGGHFELAIDSHATTAYLKSVEGGFHRVATTEEPVGPDLYRIKHTSVTSIEPFSMEMGLSGGKEVLKWIQQSWNKKVSRRNGEVRHANFDLKQTVQHQFFDALITETTFPTLDGASKEAAYLKLKFQAENVIIKKSDGSAMQSQLSVKQKMWTASAFRFNIDGIDEMQYTNKLESMTIKQGVKTMYVGAERLPQIEPTKLDFPNITGTISIGYADKLLDWYDKAVVKGVAESTQQKSGSIEYLSPDRASTLFRINLYEMGIMHAEIPQSTANQDAIKRVKFELYVGRMELDINDTGF
jgi:hypothetical protein